MKPNRQTSETRTTTAATSIIAPSEFRISDFRFRISAPMRRAFSFAEVMFAVVILGIGFIMIAAIFPVAIQQSQATNDESLASAVARESNNIISSPISFPRNTPDLAVANAFLPVLPPTVKAHYSLPGAPVPNLNAPPAILVPFTGPRWEAIKNSLILASDNRFAFVPFYRRENNSSVAQLIVVAVAVRNRSTYSNTSDIQSLSFSVTPAPPVVHANAGALIALASMTVNPDTINMSALSATTPVEGGYVTTPTNDPACPGRTYRLGRQISATLFELDPGDMLTKAAGVDGIWGTPDDTIDAVASSATYSPPCTLQPTVAYATIYSPTDGSSVAGRITLSSSFANANKSGSGVASPSFTGGLPNANIAPPAATTGAFVIVADDYPYDPTAPAGQVSYNLPLNSPSAVPPLIVGSLNARIFRLGNAVQANPSNIPPIPPGTFDLDPTYGMQSPGPNSPDQIPNPNAPSATKGPWARVFIIGVGRTTPNSTADFTYSGAAQDISVYTTFIPAQ